MKVNVNINDESLKKIDEYCKKNCITRTGFVNQVVNEFFNNLEVMKTLNDYLPTLEKLIEEKSKERIGQ